MFKKGIVKVKQGEALIRSKVLSGRVDVSFTGGLVLPVVHKAEIMDISVKTMEIDRRGSDGLICRDNIRADIKVTFFVRVNKTQDDVIKVAQAIGCDRASVQKTLEELFSAKFSEALKTAGKQLDFVDLYTQREEFRDRILAVIGTDLNGYSLEDCAIDYLEQTPLTDLDEDNILDAQGIRKITELTAIEHVRTNEFLNTEKKQITKQDVEAAEAIFELERQKADAHSRQQREIETVKAREQAETMKVQAEERLKSEQARIKSDESIAIQEENLKREVQVAEKNRERVVAVETEKVEKERQLEVIGRERETELQTISKDKEVEDRKRDIASVIRERIVVEKTVAEEEEAIKRLRVVEEASRNKEAIVISAEAEAEEALVKDIKAAEAGEQASRHTAKQQLTLAEAELAATDKLAQAKIRLAEGVKAERAAEGLAEALVKEADAEASEKLGLAEVRVKEADAEAVKLQGLAEAEILRQKGLSEADSIREQLKGEAEGLAAKAESMKILDSQSREHEEFRLRLEAQKEIDLTRVTIQKDIAESQAMVVSEGLRQANIDIVGGDSMFLDRLVNSLSMGKAADGFLEKSPGGKQILADVKDVLMRPAMGSADVKNLTLAAFLHGLIGESDGSTQQRLSQLLDAARQLGIEGMKLDEIVEK